MAEELTKRIAGLSRVKSTFLDLQLNEKSIAARQQKIPRRSNREAAPLSFAQQRLWFLDQLEPNSPIYSISKAVRLTGTISVDALQKALNGIVERHEALRTTISSVEGTPFQNIGEPRPVDLKIIDLSSLPAGHRQLRLTDVLSQEVQRPFNLSKDLMLRATLIYLANQEEYVLLLVTHHIASDGWSNGILMHEFATLYTSFITGKQLSLPPLPIQYPDFAVWQRQWLQGENLDTQVSYWKKKLHDAVVPLELPTDRPRPAIQTYRGRKQGGVLPTHLYEAIRILGHKEGSTLFMTLFAAFNVLLYRYTHQMDILIGTPIAGRTRVEIEPIIGFFVNTLVLRTNLSGNPTFRELLQRVREVALDAYSHQDMPFEKLVEELQPERSLSHSPLFQVMFILQNAPRPEWELPGLTITPLDIDSNTAKFDLTLALTEKGKELQVRFEYNSDLFNDVTITRMQEHFRILLEGIVADPNQRLLALPLLTQAERIQVLNVWNATQAEYPHDQCIHQFFEAQVERSPDAVAVTFNEQKFTFNELNRRSNQVAHNLRRHGVGPEKIVGLCLERSPEMIIGLLGILKAGGACVPLDPYYPKERLALMLRDCDSTVLLSQEKLIGTLPKHDGYIMCLGTTSLDTEGVDSENVTSNVGSHNLAYLIYTSGSTGSPKGVAMSHQAISNLIAWQLRSSTFLHGARTIQFTSLSFDVSFQEIFCTLASGGTLVLIEEAIRRDPVALHHFLAKQEVQRLFLPYIALKHLAEVCVQRSDYLPTLQEIITAGEQLRITPEIATWMMKSEEVSLENQYGPSESHVATSFELKHPIHQWHTLPPIGRPISNSQIYILGRNLELVPPGLPGELHIGGVGLCRGYFDRPETTAEKFIPNPFSDQPGSRLYRTGDWARYLSDGNIEFLGRIDHQVKIRGFRIEPGEVEAALNEFPAVQESVVIAQENAEGEKRLVSYIIAQDQKELKLKELRDYLLQKLPEYMLPSSFVMMASFPLTPTGKIDRSRLPAPEETRSAEDGDYIGPRDELEFQLTEIWERILGVKPIGIRDGFFDLGGHSLLAVKLFSQLERLTGKNLTLATLFQAQTIEKLADILRNAGWKPSSSSVVPIQIQGSKPPLFCIHAVSGNVVNYFDLARYLGTDQPFYGLQAQGLDGTSPLLNRVEDMAVHYIQEIRNFQPHGPYYLAGYSFGGLVAIEMARRLEAEGEKVAFVGLFDTHAPGYPKFLPLTTRFHKKINYHVGILRLLEPKNWLRYFLHKIRKVRRRKVRNFRQGIEKFFLPKVIRDVQISGRQALKNYVPQVYRGKITLFRATNRSLEKRLEPTLGWEKFLTGELEIIEIPGPHDIVREPAVQDLAQKLAASLDEARRKLDSSQKSDRHDEPRLRELSR